MEAPCCCLRTRPCLGLWCCSVIWRLVVRKAGHAVLIIIVILIVLGVLLGVGLTAMFRRRR